MLSKRNWRKNASSLNRLDISYLDFVQYVPRSVVWWRFYICVSFMGTTRLQCARHRRGHGRWKSEEHGLEERRAWGGAGDGVTGDVTKIPVSSSRVTKEGLCILPGEEAEKGGLAKVVAKELSLEGWIGVYGQRGRTLRQADSGLRDLDWSSGNKVKVPCRQPLGLEG